MPFNVGLPEMMIILIIALIVLGPKKLPDFGRSLGNGMREFKDSISGSSKDDDDDDAFGRPALTPAQKADAVSDPAEKPAPKTSA